MPPPAQFQSSEERLKEKMIVFNNKTFLSILRWVQIHDYVDKNYILQLSFSCRPKFTIHFINNITSVRFHQKLSCPFLDSRSRSKTVYLSDKFYPMSDKEKYDKTSLCCSLLDFYQPKLLSLCIFATAFCLNTQVYNKLRFYLF